MIPVKFNTAIPLYAVLEDETTDKVIKANVINPLTGAYISQNLVLSAVVGKAGHYSNSSVLMPNVSSLMAVFSVYEADGTTLISKGLETISLDEENGSSSSSSAVTEIVAILQDNTPSYISNVIISE